MCELKYAGGLVELVTHRKATSNYLPVLVPRQQRDL